MNKNNLIKKWINNKICYCNVISGFFLLFPYFYFYLMLEMSGPEKIIRAGNKPDVSFLRNHLRGREVRVDDF
jgi:hypothetical protein